PSVGRLSARAKRRVCGCYDTGARYQLMAHNDDEGTRRIATGRGDIVPKLCTFQPCAGTVDRAPGGGERRARPSGSASAIFLAATARCADLVALRPPYVGCAREGKAKVLPV